MDLPYRRTGHGPPLVLVHGYLGGSAQWAAQLAAFGQTHDVIAPDLPGFGQSAHLSGPDGIDGFASAVIGCLDALGIGKIRLLGHSMGGMIVQAISARCPEQVEALLLYGTGPLGLMPDRFEPVETSMQRLEAEGLQATADRICAVWFRDGATAAGYATTRDIARLANPEAARNALIAMRDWDGRGALGSFGMPCRILWGDQDRSFRWPQPEALWRGIPGAEMSVIGAASHAVHMEKPDLFNAIVLDFLSAL